MTSPPSSPSLLRSLRLLLDVRLGRLEMYSPRPITLATATGSRPRASGKLSISLVTPVRNQVDFISTTIDSVLDQGYPALEYIVMDGASNDGTAARISAYSERLSVFESRADKGQSQAINRGMTHAHGDVLGWLNGDDVLLPGALDHVAAFFEQNPDVDVVYGNRLVIDDAGREVGRWVLPPHSDRVLSFVDFVPQESLFWRRRVWDRVGGRVDEALTFAMDWDLLVRFRAVGARFRRLPFFLAAFRVHAAQKTSAQMASIGFAEMDEIRRRCLGRVPGAWHTRLAIAPYVARQVLYDRWDRLFGERRGTKPD